MLKMNDVEVTTISKNLHNYLLTEWCKTYKVISIDQDDNEILVELDGKITYDFELNGHGGYTQEELQKMKDDNIQALKEQYEFQVRYYEECCNDDDCDDQDREEAYSEMITAYNLWQDALK